MANVLASCVRSKEAATPCQEPVSPSPKALGFGTATNTLDAALSIA
jgi:hypothetical protein